MDITVKIKWDGWWSVTNTGGNKAFDFLQVAKQRKVVQSVSFGDEGYGVPGTLAVKFDGIPALIKLADERGVTVEVNNGRADITDAIRTMKAAG